MWRVHDQELMSVKAAKEHATPVITRVPSKSKFISELTSVEASYSIKCHSDTYHFAHSVIVVGEIFTLKHACRRKMIKPLG